MRAEPELSCRINGKGKRLGPRLGLGVEGEELRKWYQPVLLVANNRSEPQLSDTEKEFTGRYFGGSQNPEVH